MNAIKKSKFKNGFTLVEVLLAVSVGAILVGSSLAVLNSAGVAKKGRDNARISDLKKIQSALELHYSQNRTYPVSTSWEVASNISGLATKYIDEIPTDPSPVSGDDKPCNATLDTDRNYFYKTNASGTSYFLVGIMEVDSSAGDSRCADVYVDLGGGYFDNCTGCYLLKGPTGTVTP